jgi:hypothetical protein
MLWCDRFVYPLHLDSREYTDGDDLESEGEQDDGNYIAGPGTSLYNNLLD